MEMQLFFDNLAGFAVRDRRDGPFPFTAGF
jgi:hypothetical protein